MDREDERGRVEDLETTSNWLFAALLVGLSLIVLRFFLAFVTAGASHSGWTISGYGFTSLLWALAWFTSGFVLGFLFGIPKVLQAASKITGGKDTSSGNSEDGSAVQKEKRANVPYQLSVNTNLEEISDWLTKILVGATLTQLVKIPGMVAKAAAYLAQGIGGPAFEAFAAAIVVYFSTLGFFTGYVLTRMFFSRAFGRSDKAGLSTADVQLLQIQDTRVATGEDQHIDDSVRQSAEKSRSVQITGALSASEAGAVAKGALLVGDTNRAVQASSLAVSKNPNDVRSQLDYAIALYRAGAKSDLVLPQLTKVRDLIPPDLDPSIKQDIYNSMIYLALYQRPPDGFLKAIEWGEEYTKKSTPTSGSVWLNLAAAYGQKYRYLKEHGENVSPAQLNEVRDRALEAVKQTLKVSPSAKPRLRELTMNGTNLDDDLRVLFDDSPELQALLAE